MKTRCAVVTLLAALLVGAVLPGSVARAHAAAAVSAGAPVATVHGIDVEKAKFLLNMGVAAFCIHYVFKQYRYGKFSSGATNRVRNIAVAAAALFIAYNRLKAADKAAHKSKSKTLHTLAVPLDKLLGTTQGEYNRLHNGQFSASDVTTLNKDLYNFETLASGNGYVIHDVATALPSS